MSVNYFTQSESSVGLQIHCIDRLGQVTSAPISWKGYVSAMDSRPTQCTARVYLLGPLAVLDDAGVAFTPRGKKTQALLALLALAPRGVRSRSWLRDKLWSDRSDKQAAASLRQALLELRKSFGPHAADVIKSNSSIIELQLSRLWIDVHDTDPVSWLCDARGTAAGELPELLEGIDIRDPEFEDWLMVERQSWQRKLDAMDPGTASDIAPSRPHHAPDTLVVVSDKDSDEPVIPTADQQAADSELIRHGFGIGLLPAITPEVQPSTAAFADLVIEAIARNLQELHPLDIYDYRDAEVQTFGVNTGPGPDVLLRVRVQQLGSSVGLSLLAYRSATQKLIWSHSVQADQSEVLHLDSLTLSGFVNQNVDRLAHAFFAGGRGSADPVHTSAENAFAALNLMFRNETQSLHAAENLLLQSPIDEAQSIPLGLLAYMSSFRVGEHLEEFDDEQRLATIDRAQRALTIDPFNSMTLACVGHVNGYVLRDFSTAAELLQQAIAINPHQAFVWDHYALLKLYTGEIDAAVAASRRAVQLGSFSPLRYSFETTLAMSLTLQGDYRTAVHYGNRALSRQRNFAAAMRYMVACYGHLGEPQKAAPMLRQLHALDASGSNEQLLHSTLATTNEDARQRLLEGYSKASTVR